MIYTILHISAVIYFFNTVYLIILPFLFEASHPAYRNRAGWGSNFHKCLFDIIKREPEKNNGNKPVCKYTDGNVFDCGSKKKHTCIYDEQDYWQEKNAFFAVNAQKFCRCKRMVIPFFHTVAFLRNPIEKTIPCRERLRKPEEDNVIMLAAGANASPTGSIECFGFKNVWQSP